MSLITEVFIPDGEESRALAEEELSRSIYAEAKPTFLDIWARDLADFLARIFSNEGGGAIGPWGVVIAIALILAALIAALLLWGIPRRSRAVRRPTRELLGASDTRTAAQLRSEADKRARAGDWSEAIVLRYRAIARGLLERDLIDPTPGATAQAIAREASSAFAEESTALMRAAMIFDEVRYLELPGTREDYGLVAELDDRIRTEQARTVPA